LEPGGAEGEALAQLLIRPRDPRSPASAAADSASPLRRANTAKPPGAGVGGSQASRVSCSTRVAAGAQAVPRDPAGPTEPKPAPSASPADHPASTAKSTQALPAPVPGHQLPAADAPDSRQAVIQFRAQAPPAVLADQVRARAAWREARLREQAGERATPAAQPARETADRSASQAEHRPEAGTTPDPAPAPSNPGHAAPLATAERSAAQESATRPTPEPSAAPVSHATPPADASAGPSPAPVALPPVPPPAIESRPAATATATVAGRLAAARNSTVLTEARAGWNALLEQLQGRVDQLRLSDGGQARLSLEPAELGHLDLLLERAEGGWRLEIRAGSADTARQLQNQAQELHDRLLAAGVRLDELRLQSPGAGVGTEPPGPLPALSEDVPATATDPDSSGKRRAPDEAEGEAAGERKSPSGPPGEEFASRLESLLRRGGAGGAR